MRTLDVPERTCPGAALILDLDVYASGVADLGADDKYATRQSLALCAHAFAASSLTIRTASSAAGCPSRKWAIKARA